MGLHRHGLLVDAADAVALGHHFGGMPHGHVGLRIAVHQLRVGGDVEAAHGHAGHGFHAAAEESLARSQLDLAGGIVDGAHGGATEAVDGGASDGFWQAGEEAGDARDVHALLGFGVGAAEDQVFDLAGVDIQAFYQAFHHLGGEVVGTKIDQPAFFREMEGRAGITGNDDGVHGRLLVGGGRP
ncbi:hypothetical protein D3C80_1603810 [compost metagenome]